MTTGSWDPWREFDRLRREMNDMFGRWGIGRAGEFPPINVWTNNEGAVLTSELPGIDPAKLEISILGDTLTIKGEREEREREAGYTFHRCERGFGPFTRTVQLEFRIDGGSAHASYKRGVLEVLAPRAAADRPRSITVTPG